MSECLTLDYGTILNYYGDVWEPLCCYTVPSQTYDDFVNGLTEYYNNSCPKDKVFSDYVTKLYNNCLSGSSGGGTGSTGVYVTGGTANGANSTLNFTNTTGGTFTVTNSALLFNDAFVTGGTLNQATGVVTFTNSSGGTFTVSGFDDFASYWSGSSDGTSITTSGSNTTTNVNLPGLLGVTGDTTISGVLGVGSEIYHVGDPDTKILFTDDDINITVGNVNMVDFTQDTTNEITFNEAGVDVDVRMEGTDESNLFFLDAGNDRVGIRTGTPSSVLDVNGAVRISGKTFMEKTLGVSGVTYSNVVSANTQHIANTLGISGKTYLGSVDTATATASDKILVVQSTGEIESITTGALTAFTSDYWVGNGSGTGIKPSGTTTNVDVTGVLGVTGNSTFGGSILLGDGSVSANYVGVGDSDDLKIFHNGSHSIIRETGTGSLYLQSDNNVIISKDSSTELMVKGIADGAVELYYDNVKKFETTSVGVNVSGNTLIKNELGVSGRTYLGTIDAAGGSYSADKILVAQGDGEIEYLTTAELKADIADADYWTGNTDGTSITPSGGTTNTDIKLNGGLTAQTLNISGNTSLGDNDKIMLGADNDLEVFANSSGGRIDVGSSTLQVQGDTLDFVDGSATSYLFRGVASGAVSLYYSGTKKFETTSSGVNVSGNTLVKNELGVSGKTYLGTIDAAGGSYSADKILVAQGDGEIEYLTTAELKADIGDNDYWVGNGSGTGIKPSGGTVNVDVTGQLGVSGDTTINGDLYVSQKIKHIGDPNTFINFLDDRIQFDVGGISYIDLNDASSAPHDIIFNNGNNDVDLTIKGGSSTILFTDASTHRVGIGTETPTVKLDVNGDVKISGDTYIKTNLGVTGVTYSNIVSANTQHIASTLGISGKTYLGSVDTATATASDKILVVQSTGEIESITTGALTAFTSDYWQGNGSGTGVKPSGTTTNVDVTGVLGVTGKTFISGDVGIGTTDPQKKLDIAGGDIRLDNSKSIFFATTDGNIGRVAITGDEGSDFIQMKVDNSNSHLFRLDTTGVGIGTSTPTAKLDIDGNVKISGDTSIKTNLGVTGNTYVKGNTFIDGTLSAMGNTTLSGTLDLNSVAAITPTPTSSEVILVKDTAGVVKSITKAQLTGFTENYWSSNTDSLSISPSGSTNILLSGGSGTGYPLTIDREDNGHFLKFHSNSNPHQDYTFESESTGSFYGLNLKNKDGDTIVNFAANQMFGVGTINPTVAIDVDGGLSGADALQVRIAGRTGIGHSNSGQQRSIFGNSYGNDATRMGFTLGGYTTADEKITVMGTGVVGIGTATETIRARLHVSGSTILTDSLGVSGNTNINGVLSGVTDARFGGNLGVSGRTFLGSVDTATATASDKILVVQSTGEIESITTAALTGFTSDYWVGNGTGTGIKPSGTTTNVDITGVLGISGNTYLPGNGSIIFDNGEATMTHSGSGDFTIDVADDIRLDAGGGDVVLRAGGTEYGRLSNSSANLVIQNTTSDKDIIFKGSEGGSTITALTLDISEGGNATFNRDVNVSGVTSGRTDARFGGDLSVTGRTFLGTIDAAGGSYSADKILVAQSNGEVEYLTTAELKADIGDSDHWTGNTDGTSITPSGGTTNTDIKLNAGLTAQTLNISGMTILDSQVQIGDGNGRVTIAESDGDIVGYETADAVTEAYMLSNHTQGGKLSLYNAGTIYNLFSYNADSYINTSSYGFVVGATSTSHKFEVKNGTTLVEEFTASELVTAEGNANISGNTFNQGNLGVTGVTYSNIVSANTQHIASTLGISGKTYLGSVDTATATASDKILVVQSTGEIESITTAALTGFTSDYWVGNGSGTGIKPSGGTVNVDVTGQLGVSGKTTMTGDLKIDDAIIDIDPDTNGTVLVWRETDGTTIAGQLRSYSNRGDIYLYYNGDKTAEITAIGSSFLPGLDVNGTLSAMGNTALNGVLGVSGNTTVTGMITGSSHVLVGGDLNTSGRTFLGTIDAAGSSYSNDKILVVQSNGEVEYLTTAELKADIGDSDHWTGNTDGTSITPSGGTTNTDIKLNAGLTAQTLNVSGNTILGDNDKIMLGDANDLQIFHNGSHSIIKDVGTGHLSLQGNDLRLNNADWSANYLTAANGGEVAIFHNNSLKLTTTSTGINVSGNTLVKNELGVSGKTYLGDIGAAGDGYSADKILVAQGDGEVEYLTTAQLKADIGDNDYWVGNGSGTGIKPSGTTTNVDITGVLGVSGKTNITGDLDVDGTSNLDTVDIDGNTQMDGTLTVGVDDTGHDVKFFGDDSGEYMFWDTSSARLEIKHTDESVGLEVYTNAAATTTQPQLKIGRSSSQYWGVYTDDRNAHLVHRQDETSGTMTTRFDQWDSNTSDTTGEWLWRFGNGSGGSMAEAMKLTQAGTLSTTTQHISSTLGVSGRTFLGTVDTATATASDKILVVQSTGEIESITTAALTGFTSDYWVGNGSGTGIKPSGTTTNVDVTGVLGVSGKTNITGDLDVDGTSNLDGVDIDGNTQMDGTLTVGVDDTGYDVKFFGDTASSYMLWDTSEDRLEVGANLSPRIRLYRSGTGQVWQQEIDSSGRLQLKEAASAGGTLNVRLQIDDTGEVDLYNTLTVGGGDVIISGDTFNKGDLGVTGITYSNTVSANTQHIASTLGVSGRTYLGTIDAAGASYSNDKILVAQSNGEVEYLTTAQLKADIGDNDYWQGNGSGTGIKPSGTTTNVDVTGVLGVSGDTTISGDLFVSEYIKHAGDSDTFIQFADDSIGINAGNEQLITISESPTFVKIGDGGDVDFQVRTNSDDNTLYVEGSTDRVGIGTNTPTVKLDVNGSVRITGDTFTKGNLGVTGNTYVKGNTYIDGTLSAMGNTTLTGTLDLNSVAAITPTPTSTEVILVKDTSGVVKSITKAQLTGITEGLYWEEDGTGTGIKPSGATTNIKLGGGLTAQTLNVSGNTILGDDDKIMLGDANDLQIYHDGSNSFIQDTGTGDLYIDAATNFFVRNKTNGEVWIQGTDGGVNLRYQDSTKITTTSAGVNVSGNTLIKNELGVSGKTYLGDIGAAGGSYSADKILVAQGDGEVEYLTTAQLKADIGDNDYWQGNGSGTGIKPSGTTTNVDVTGQLGVSGRTILNGLVGVNTVSTPTVTFEVNGDGKIKNLLLGNNSTTGPSADLHIKSSGTDAKLRIEDLDASNLYFDFYVNNGDGLAIIENQDGGADNTVLKLHKGVVSATGTLGVSGNTNISGTLSAMGNTTLNNNLLVKDNIIRIGDSDSSIKFSSGYKVEIGDVEGTTNETILTVDDANSIITANSSVLGISGKTFLGSVDTATATASDKILVVQSTGEIESITTASLTGFTSDYWEGDGTGTGIKTSGYTNTTVKIRKLDVDDGAIEYDPNNSVVKFGGDNSVVFNQDNGDVEFTVLGGSGGGSSNKVFQLDLADGGHGATFFTNNGNTPTQTLVVNGIISGNTNARFNGVVGISGRTYLGTIDAAGGSYSADKILVAQSNGEVEYLTTAELKADIGDNDYWVGNGSGTGIKPSGTTTNVDVTGVLGVTGKTFISGNVGIGTTNPSEKLHVNGGHLEVQNAGNTNIYINAQTNSDATVWFQENGSAKGKIQHDASNDSILITDGANTTTMTLKSAQVGIGTTTPTAELDVNGDVKISGNTFNKGNLGVTGVTYSNIVSAHTQHIASTLGISGRTYLGTIDAAGASYSNDKILVAQSNGEVEYLTTAQLKADIGDNDYWQGNGSGTGVKPSGTTTNVDVTGVLGVSGKTNISGDLTTHDIFIDEGDKVYFDGTDGSPNTYINKNGTGLNLVVNGDQKLYLTPTTTTLLDNNVIIKGGNVNISGNTFNKGNLGVTGNTYVKGNTFIDGTLSAMGNTTLSGTLDLNSVAAITPTPTSTEVILVKDTSGVVKSITKAQLTGITEGLYWVEDGVGTGIKPSGATTNITIGGDITANGNIVGDNSTNISGINTLEVSTVHGQGDDDTKITFTADDINITAGNVNMLDFTQNDGGQDEITFNEAGADIDVRMEGDTDQNLFFLDAGNDKIAIGTDTVSSSLLTVDGSIQAGSAGFIVGNATLTSAELDISSGDFLLDVEGDITLDANGADIILSDNGTDFGRFKRDASHFIIKAETNNKDIIFRGQDAASTIDALLLDMSEAGSATFNRDVNVSGVTSGRTDARFGGDLSVTGRTFLGTIDAAGSSYSFGHILVAQSNGEVEYLTTAQLKEDIGDNDYWQGNGSGTGIKPSGTTTNVDVTGELGVSGKTIVTGDLSTDGILYTDDIRRLTDNSTTTRIQLAGNNINMYAGSAGNSILNLVSNAGAVFNQNGYANWDFRVEGDTDTHLIFADAGADKVAIGTDTVSEALLTVDGDTRISGDTFSKGNLGVTGNTYVKGNTFIDGTLSAMGNTTLSGTLDLNSVGTATPTPTSAERILVRQTSGVVESITKAQLTGLTDFSTVTTYWQEDGTGTGIKPSGATTNIKLGAGLTAQTLNISGNTILGTENKLMLGNANDLQIYHDGTDNHIEAKDTLNIATGNSGIAVNIGHTTSETTVNDNLNVTGDLAVDGTSNLDNTDIDGTLVVDGTNISLDSTTTLNIDNSNTSNGITIGTATSSVPISIGHTTSETTVNDNLSVTGDLDVDGTTNLDAVDIDGNVQLDGTFTVGVDNTGYDVKFFGATSGKYMLWDEDQDSLDVKGILNLEGGTSGAAPTPQLKFGAYTDTSGGPSVSHIDLYGGVYGFGVTSADLDYVTDRNHKFYSDGTTSAAVTINPDTFYDGVMGINTEIPAFDLDVFGDIRISGGSIGVNINPSATDGRIDASNDVVAYSSSDKRWKENIQPIENALDKVSQISGVEFDWKKLTKEEKKTQHGNEGHDIGVIAQEIEKVLPEIVTTRENGYKGVRYEKIVPLLIESIKELKAEIEELKNK